MAQMTSRELSPARCNCLSPGIQHLQLRFQPIGRPLAQSHLSLHSSFRLRHLWGGDAHSPCIDGTLTAQDELHRAVESASGIPSAAQFHIIQLHFQHIVPAAQIGCGIHAESIVATSPSACQLPVDIHLGLCHCSIKEQFGMCVGTRNAELRAIFTLAGPGQTTGIARRLVCLFLSIHPSLALPQVDITVKLARDGPVMRQSHCLQRSAVLGELPSVTQGYRLMHLGQRARCEGQGKCQPGQEMLGSIHIYIMCSHAGN